MDEMWESIVTFDDPVSMPFRLFVSKFGVTLALHLNIFPVLISSFNILKYVNNHPDLFD